MGIEFKHFDLLFNQSEALSVGFKSAVLVPNAVREENFPDPPLEAGDPSHSARPSGQQNQDQRDTARQFRQGLLNWPSDALAETAASPGWANEKREQAREFLRISRYG